MHTITIWGADARVVALRLVCEEEIIHIDYWLDILIINYDSFFGKYVG